MPGDRKVRVGLVGTGRWADVVHAPGVKSHPNAELVAVCSRTREKVEAMAARYGVPQVFTDYADLIAMDDLDAVIVATTNVTHHPICMAAIQRGLHVFCEKPLGMTVAQTRELHAAAEKAGVKHMVAFTCRWLPHAIYVKQLLDDGYVGKVYHLTVTKLAGYAGTGSERRWRFHRPVSGGGVLADLGVHMIDLARWYLGEFRSICGHSPTFVSERRDPNGPGMLPCDVDDAAAFIAEFEGGVQGVFHISWVARRQHDQTVTICGEKGSIVFGAGIEEWDFSLRGSQAPDNTLAPLDVPKRLMGAIDVGAPGGGFGSFVRDYPSMARRFIDVIINDEPPSPSFYDGMRAQEVMQAITTSWRQHRWVDLPSPTGS